MKSILGSAVVVAFTAATFVACGGSSNDQAKDPSDQRAMNQLTPSQREESQRRAGKEDQRERELANAREPQPTAASNDGTRTTTALAVSSISTARCDRELKCKNIGTNKTYLNTDECVTKMQNDKRTGLNANECPNGVSDKDLASCLKSIREEDCGNPLDSIARLTACRSGGMCLK
ncbi:MAG TPA: DUF6184 family natural product biosynthesis lipoprotein [Polyangiaceae bacterium]|nr:DUF6184 family natural product biosynthesis lipoprotein [Polyangiaceae bacterium]